VDRETVGLTRYVEDNTINADNKRRFVAELSVFARLKWKCQHRASENYLIYAHSLEYTLSSVPMSSFLEPFYSVNVKTIATNQANHVCQEVVG
jgi:hypothetical protein